jgi:hypothetical protein
MTRKELRQFVNIAKRHNAKVKIGYCCYQDDNISKWELNEIGYNSGVYGWNWSCYFHYDTNTVYISCYRNVPNDIYAMADR